MTGTGAKLSGARDLADVMRVQWVNPKVARALVAAGYHNAASVAAADPGGLCAALAEANEIGHDYRVPIGLRGVGRLVVSAGFVDHARRRAGGSGDRRATPKPKGETVERYRRAGERPLR